MIDAAQIRAARALLDISQLQLAAMSAVSESTIKRLEAASTIRGSAESIWFRGYLRRPVLNSFPDEGGQGPGVRLRENRRRVIWPG